MIDFKKKTPELEAFLLHFLFVNICLSILPDVTSREKLEVEILHSD